MEQVDRSPSSSKLSATERRPKTSGDSKTPFFKRRSHLGDVKRDSGLAPSFVTAPKDSTTDTALIAEPHLRTPGPELRNVPSIALNDEVQDTSPKSTGQQQRPHTAPGGSAPPVGPSGNTDKYATTNVPPLPSHAFGFLKTSIETGAFDDPFSSSHLTFSKRGSILVDGQRSNGSLRGSASPNKSHKESSGTMSPHTQTSTLAPQRTLSINEKRLSQQIRSLYEGDEEGKGLGILPEQPGSEHEGSISKSDDVDTVPTVPPLSHTSPDRSNGDLSPSSRPPNDKRSRGRGLSHPKLEPWEAAGGLEDWRDVDSADVDRYGFIRKASKASQTSSRLQTPVNGSPEQRPQGRGGSNSLSSPEEGTTKHRKLQRPPPDSSRSHRLSVTGRSTRSAGTSRPPSRAPSRGSFAPSAAASIRSRRSLNPFRPNPNKHRRWADEAPTMLLPPPRFPPSSPSANPNIKTERLRVEKWRKMAIPVQNRTNPKRGLMGGGQLYTFDHDSRKLQDRVWKGIPEVWRAQAWHDFLTPRTGSTESDEELITRYRQHKEENCADDQQIHLDVPRTAGDHVLFRVERKGGQRFLFYVLRALALEFPDTGYTQGMATVAATLLTYFPEEEAFVCAYRLWKDRGLAELFAPGFENLKNTVQGFEHGWLARNPMRTHLEAMGVDPMVYSMRWYLTLFNYALPFEALMRVWDVFMLLGGRTRRKGGKGAGVPGGHGTADHGKFDVLHAVAAALIDGLAEVLADGEYETAMGALTKHVDVRNADVLMSIARREFESA